MGQMSPQVEREFNRWLAQVGDNDNYESPTTIGIKDVLKAHFLIADFFLSEGSGLGGVGPKDMSLLHSALYRQHMCFGGVCKWSDKYERVATVMYGLIKDHPFHDANKRTAFLSTLYLLSKMGLTPTVSEKEFEDFLVDVADDKIQNKPRYKSLKEKNEDPEIKYIAWWIRSHTRNIDHRQYLITYKQLKGILNRFGFELENPDKNSIDVVKYTQKQVRVFLSKKTVTERVRLGTIKFPGYSKEVAKSELKRVREMTGLTAKNGCDSQVFYNDADHLEALIAKYQEPLKRLADR